MSKELVTKAEAIRDEVRVGANTAKRIGGLLTEISREVNGLYDNVLDWINNEKPVGNGFILTQSDVINSLEDASELKPLSAKQGMILKAILDALVVDDTTTNDGAKALSARQGKKIADNLKEHNHDSVYQKKGNYATDIHKHAAIDIEENTTHRFMTDNEKNTLSSLGTNAALKDFSNVTTQNLGQNGYCKFPNGLMVQWGYASNSSNGNATIYMPMSFYSDTTYSLVTTMETASSDPAVFVAIPYYKSIAYFSVKRRYVTSDGVGDTPRSFYWLAIGRWK